MKSKSLIFIGLICFQSMFALNLLAQQNTDYDRWAIKLNGKPTRDHYGRKDYGFINAEATYKIKNFLELGLGTGLQKRYYVPDLTNPQLTPTNTYRFDALVNLHILPLIFGNQTFRLNLYLAGKTGLFKISRHFEEEFDYFLGGGASFFVTRNIGLYGEYGIMRDVKERRPFKPQQKEMLFLGIVVKF